MRFFDKLCLESPKALPAMLRWEGLRKSNGQLAGVKVSQKGGYG